MTDDATALRNEVRLASLQRGCTQRFLSRQIGVSEGQFSNWVRGRRELQPEQLQRLRECLREASAGAETA
jgi:transcriptional regulator with XRE-family HTH domain